MVRSNVPVNAQERNAFRRRRPPMLGKGRAAAGIRRSAAAKPAFPTIAPGGSTSAPPARGVAAVRPRLKLNVSRLFRPARVRPQQADGPTDSVVIDMISVLSATCPNCKTIIGDDDRRCRGCGTGVSEWPHVDRAPLILPDNPALREDDLGESLSPMRMLGMTAAVLAVVSAGLYVWSTSAPEGPEFQLATRASRAATGPAIRPAAVIQTLTREAEPTASPAPVSTVALPTASLTAAAVRQAIPVPPKEPPAVATTVPQLRIVPLYFDSLRPGDLLQLRWTLEGRPKGGALPTDLEFTSSDVSIASVDRRIGTVSAHKPGQVRISVDAGTAGQSDVTLTVQPAQPAARGAVGPGKIRILKR